MKIYYWRLLFFIRYSDNRGIWFRYPFYRTQCIHVLSSRDAVTCCSSVMARPAMTLEAVDVAVRSFEERPAIQDDENDNNLQDKIIPAQMINTSRHIQRILSKRKGWQTPITQKYKWSRTSTQTNEVLLLFSYNRHHLGSELQLRYVTSWCLYDI